MTALSYSDVLKSARQLPVGVQVELVQALLGNIRSAIKTSNEPDKKSGLSPLADMTQQELTALADAVVAPERQGQLRMFLEENRNDTLSSEGETALDSLLDEVDQVALLKARALYTLRLQQSKHGA